MSAHGSTAVYGILSPIDCSGRPVPEVRRIFEARGSRFWADTKWGKTAAVTGLSAEADFVIAS
jgi:hypothetical protein